MHKLVTSPPPPPLFLFLPLSLSLSAPGFQNRKMRTIVVKVDLQCCRCYAKIRKVLACIQEQKEFSIDKIVYEEKENKVTISGPFDPEKLRDKLYCMAGKIIKGIEILPKPKEPKKETPSPCKLLPYPCPYPLPYQCPTWPSGCSDKCGHDGCQCCSKPLPPPPKPSPCSCPPQPSGCCDDHRHGGCHYCPKPQPCPPFPPYPFPAPLCEYKFISEDNPSYACSIM